MSEAPDWVGTPYAPVHNEPSRAAQWQGMSQDQLEGLRTRLVESFIQVVVQAVTGLFIPGGVTGEAYEQLTAWADNIAEALEEIPIIGDIIEVLTGVEDGDLNDLGSWVADLIDSDSFQDLIDTLWQGITRLTGTGNLIEDLFDAIQHIPFLNILGTGGPSNLGEALRAGWDAIVSGLVGEVGNGSGLADLFNVPFLVSSRATKGEWSWDILGIRNNQSLFTGFAPTSTSNLNMATLAFNKVSGTPTAPTVPVTQSTALTAWHRVSQAMDLGVVGWTGSGVTSITDFRINIWGMDPSTGDITVLHHSTNQAGLLSGSMADVLYSLPTALTVEAGDLIGIELHPIGAGTHNVVGDTTWRDFNHATVVPRRWSSKRNGGTSTATPSDISDASIDYATTYIPFIEYGVTGASSVALPHSPEARLFSTAGATSTPIPSWCTHIDLVAVGGGGGGEGCGLLWGQGGRAGSWTGIRLERGVEIPESTTTLNITVGDGGGAGAGIGDNGDPGTASTVTATGMTTFTANGGAGGSATNADTTGQSPGNYTFAETLFIGGAAETVYFNDGNPPGGGGAGSTIIFVEAGSGAPGQVWTVFRQLYSPDPPALTISPTSIASAESFGTPGVFVTIMVTPTSIASAESFGTPTVTVWGFITPTSIPSAESFGTPIIEVAGTIAPTSIPSAESFGTPTVAVGLLVAPSSIASAESFGTPSVSVALHIQPSSIASAESVGTPTLSEFTPFTVENTNVSGDPVPVGATGCWLTMVGGGGGGGTGRHTTATSTTRGGAAGGGGGARYPRFFIPISDLGSTYSLTRGLGGPGATTTASLNAGNPGTAGTSSIFTSGSVTVTAAGGAAGPAGNNGGGGFPGGAGGAASSSGLSSSPTGYNGSAGGGGSISTTAEVGVNNTAGGAAGGGGGSGRSSSNVSGTPAKGGNTTTGTGGAAGSPNGSSGPDQSAGNPGPGGGGGGSGGAGGAGGDWGGGGGGGGWNNVTSPVKAGGDGANGYTKVEWVNT